MSTIITLTCNQRFCENTTLAPNGDGKLPKGWTKFNARENDDLNLQVERVASGHFCPNHTLNLKPESWCRK